MDIEKIISSVSAKASAEIVSARAKLQRARNSSFPCSKARLLSEAAGHRIRAKWLAAYVRSVSAVYA